MKIDFARIAGDVLFGGVLDKAKHGVMYREGKTSHDIAHAVRKAAKSGRGKVELELGLLEVYLKTILKAA